MMSWSACIEFSDTRYLRDMLNSGKYNHCRVLTKEEINYSAMPCQMPPPETLVTKEPIELPSCDYERGYPFGASLLVAFKVWIAAVDQMRLANR